MIVCGLLGVNGLHVLLLVELEPKKSPDGKRQEPKMAESHVKDLIQKQIDVSFDHAEQVSKGGKSSNYDSK